MKDFHRVLSAERLKLKRTLVSKIAVLAPVVVVLLVFGVEVVRGGKVSKGDQPVTDLAQKAFVIWTLLMLPFYASLAAALLAALEHNGDNWKHVLALPVRRQSIFSAKLIAGGTLLFISSLVWAAAILIAGEVLRLVRPDWSGAALPVVMVIRGSMLSFCAAGLLFSIQMWISLRWRNFALGLGLGIVAIIVNILVVSAPTFVIASFPWFLPAVAIIPHDIGPYRVIGVMWGLLGGIAVGTIACMDLSRREFQ